MGREVDLHRKQGCRRMQKPQSPGDKRPSIACQPRLSMISLKKKIEKNTGKYSTMCKTYIVYTMC